MAIAATYTKRQEQTANQQQPVSSNKSYTGMNGVSQNTANNLGNYQAGYKPGEQVQQAQQYLQQVQSQKPASYNSKWAPQLESILQQIQDPQEYKYEFNGDELFKYYADLYSQNGKQAAMDVLGNASALTGGYGNSYGQQVAQQQYQEYLRPLYDKGMELQQAAYQRYRDQLGDLQNAYNYTADAENRDYNQYRDALGDWMNEREYAANRADTERNFDYNEYTQNLDYWTGLAQIENAAWNTEAERQEAIRQYEQNFAESQRQYDASLAENQRQYDASLAENQRQYDRNLAANYATSILANGQIPSIELLQAAGLSLEDAQKLIAVAKGSGGSGNGLEKAIKMLGETIDAQANSSVKQLMTGITPLVQATAVADATRQSLQGLTNGLSSKTLSASKQKTSLLSTQDNNKLKQQSTK